MSQAIWKAIERIEATIAKYTAGSAKKGARLYAARYKTNVALQFNNSVTTIVDYATMEYDDGGRVTTGASWQYLSGLDTLYRVGAGALFEASTQWAPGESVSLLFYKNGSLYSAPYRFDSFVGGGTSQFGHVFGADTIPLAVGDTFDVRLAQTSGAVAGYLPLHTNAAFNFVTIDPV